MENKDFSTSFLKGDSFPVHFRCRCSTIKRKRSEKNMNQTLLTDKKIAVVGIGGVGGYMAGMLAKHYPHVTLAARGKRKESLQNHGLVLHSDYNGEITAFPEKIVTVEDLEEQDYIFVCVKNYSLEEVCQSIAHAVTDHTVIVPVMNGTDPGDRIRNILHKGTVVDSLIYIVAFANTDYSITQQGKFANLYIGIKNADALQAQAVSEVSDILTGAGIDHKCAPDIEQAIWRKYILNCAYNVATAAYDNTIGELRADPEKTAEYEALVQEAYQIALAKQVDIRPKHIEIIIDKFHNDYADDATSSLQRDIRAGLQAELDTFSGYIVREAEKYGISVPVSRKMYEILKEKTGLL